MPRFAPRYGILAFAALVTLFACTETVSADQNQNNDGQRHQNNNGQRHQNNNGQQNQNNDGQQNQNNNGQRNNRPVNLLNGMVQRQHGQNGAGQRGRMGWFGPPQQANQGRFPGKGQGGPNVRANNQPKFKGKPRENVIADKLIVNLRTFTDVTGKHQIKAELKSVRGSNVILQTADGSEVEVPIRNLSDADLKWTINELKVRKAVAGN